MGALIAWALIALIAPVLPSGDALPEAVFAVAAGAVLTFVPDRMWHVSAPRLEQVAWAAALIGVAGGLLRVPFLVPGYETTPASATWMAAAQCVLLVVVLLLAPPVRRHLDTRATAALLGAAIGAATLLCAALIVGVPDPGIDVFYSLNEGARGLLNGMNPFAMTFTSLPPTNPGYQDPAYHFDVYGYLPGLLLLSLPTVPSGDVRWLMLIAIPVAAVCLRSLARRGGASGTRADLVTLAFVSYPGLAWVIREAWPEPVIVAAFLAGLWALIGGYLNWAVVGVAVFLSIKQYPPMLVLPFWAAGLSIRRIALAAGIVVAISLPFVVWSPGDFWWDAVWYRLQAPERVDAVSFNGYLLARFNASVPGWLSIGPLLVGTLYAVWQAWRGADWRVVLRLTAGTFFLLFLFNKFAFANYYFLLQALLLATGGVTAVCSASGVESRR